MKFKLIHLDTCYPDYFSGFSGETLIAFYHKGQTLKEVLKDLELNLNNECRDSWVYEAFHKEKERIQIEHKDILDKVFLPKLEFNSETDLKIDQEREEYREEESLIHYFGLIEDKYEM